MAGHNVATNTLFDSLQPVTEHAIQPFPQKPNRKQNQGDAPGNG